MPGCSSRPVISASTTKRARLSLVGGVIELDPLEGDVAVQLLVAGDVDLAQAAAVVEADDPEAALGVGGRAFLVPIRGALAVGVFTGVAGEAEIEEAGLEVEVGELLEVVADRGDDGERRPGCARGRSRAAGGAPGPGSAARHGVPG